MIGLSKMIDVPPDLIDWLLRLIQQGGRELFPMPEVPSIIPPAWRPWLSPISEIQRRLEDAARAAARDAAAAAYARARMEALDVLVGAPCLAAAGVFASTGHADAALLLREFVNATGPQTRSFAVGSAFSLGFARSETTTKSVAGALRIWKDRAGGLQANGGTITRLSSTFVPLAPTIRLLPMPGPGVRVIGSPEAHVIGSFSYQGRLIGNDIAEWEASNQLSLKSYFADNWTKRVNTHLVDDNARPAKYGSTNQVIAWRTTLDGAVMG